MRSATSNVGLIFLASLIFPTSALSGNGVVCLYADRDFQGARFCYDEDIASFRDIRLNDAVSSIRILGGAKVRLYEHGGFRGRSVVVEDDIAALAPSLNDEFSSMRLVERETLQYENWDEEEYSADRRARRDAYWGRESERRYPAEPASPRARHPRRSATQAAGVCVYEHRDYQGWERCFISGHPNFADLGIDNKISSVRVVGNVKAHLFEDVNYRGRKRVFLESDPLLERGENDTFSSLAITSR